MAHAQLGVKTIVSVAFDCIGGCSAVNDLWQLRRMLGDTLYGAV